MAVVMPNITCTHCVLRVRYESHKAGEQTFYQCADITIKMPSKQEPVIYDHNSLTKDDKAHLPNSLRRAWLLPRSQPVNNLAESSIENEINSGSKAGAIPGATNPSLYGISWNPRQPGKGGHLVSIDAVTGAIQPILGVYFGVGPDIQYGTPSPMQQSQKFVMDAITCYSREIPYLFLLEHRNGDLDLRPNKILWIDMSARDIAGEYEIEYYAPEALHIASLTPYKRTDFLTFEIQPTDGSPGYFTFKVGKLDYMGNHMNLYTDPKPENLYVNFLFSTLDIKRYMHYSLVGNENDLTKLTSRIHAFNFTTGKAFITEVNVTQYTINAIQAYEKTGQLLAVSPGLFPKEYPPWYLVEVNATTGDIKPIFEIAPSGMFAPYYGGAVVNIDQTNGVMYYVFRVADSIANIIATIDIESKTVGFSQLTSLQFVHNIAHFDPNNP